MAKNYIFDPTLLDPISSSRGGGRFIQLLKENVSKATFINDLHNVDAEGTLLIPFFNPFIKPLLEKRIAQKQIVLIYDTIPLKYPAHFPVGIRGNINLFRNKQSLKHYDRIVTISEVSKNDIQRYLNIPKEKIDVIYPTLSQSFVNATLEPLRTPLPKAYCVYVGDVNWNKNIVNMAKAIKIARIPCIFVGKAFEPLSEYQQNVLGGTLERDPDSAQLSSTGGKGQAGQNLMHFTQSLSHPWQKEFKQFVDETKDDPLFIFPGYVTDGQLKELYQHASLNLLLSRGEGFGFSYLEASNLSTPSLLSDIDIFHEIAGDTALFVNPEKPEEIAKKIQLIMRSEELQMKLEREAKTRAAFFSNEKFEQSWKAVLTI